MKKGSVVMIAAVLTAALAGSAQAQICAGFPTFDRQFSFGARIDFPEDLDSWGVEASYNFSGPLALFGGVNVVSADDAEEEVFRAGVAFDLPALGAALGPAISVCPVAELLFAEDDGDSVMAIPLGLGLGANLSAGPGVLLAPYVIPQLMITRFNFDDDDPLAPEDETETDFAIRAGALLGFGMFFVGAEVTHTFRDFAPDPTFGIRAGIRL